MYIHLYSHYDWSSFIYMCDIIILDKSWRFLKILTIPSPSGPVMAPGIEVDLWRRSRGMEAKFVASKFGHANRATAACTFSTSRQMGTRRAGLSLPMSTLRKRKTLGKTQSESRLAASTRVRERRRYSNSFFSSFYLLSLLWLFPCCCVHKSEGF